MHASGVYNVPQDSVLRSVLFLLYTNDLIENAQEAKLVLFASLIMRSLIFF
jgi:hypothetical protein